jgi:hypothetical protein
LFCIVVAISLCSNVVHIVALPRFYFFVSYPVSTLFWLRPYYFFDAYPVSTFLCNLSSFCCSYPISTFLFATSILLFVIHYPFLPFCLLLRFYLFDAYFLCISRFYLFVCYLLSNFCSLIVKITF